MKAVVVNAPGGPEVLNIEERPIPQAEAGKVLIHVRAFGLNHSEVVTRAGGSGGMVKFPRVLGIELVGEVVDAPGSDLQPGQRVLAMSAGLGRDIDGGYAEYTLVPERAVVPVNTELEWSQLAAVPMTFGTARGTVDKIMPNEGETVLVHGGSTAVGIAVIALAKERGATVIATTRREGKRAALEKAGADHVLVLDNDPTDAVRALFPDGVDALAEFIGPDAMQEALQSVKRGGKACITGFLAGYPPFGPDGKPVLSDVKAVADKRDISFSFFGSNVLNREQFGEIYQEIVDAIESGRVSTNIDRIFALGDIAEAHRYMDEYRAAGKLVVDLTIDA
ncbi:zinc-binding dehydrogenase [Rhodococcus sp. T2V]|uniref:zinc-binding dehydrogenase n=1 Tax=Rhodococcus sp. T2V TaxID=3034164 RepID=UPI0023E1390A|nr:zinc-binding dehydrogenase [Rhodococcus sp. T2V]MDF3312593.1 zinc-binding dehydrogenase [Rhodococcus sp. T2V]